MGNGAVKELFKAGIKAYKGVRQAKKAAKELDKIKFEHSNVASRVKTAKGDQAGKEVKDAVKYKAKKLIKRGIAATAIGTTAGYVVGKSSGKASETSKKKKPLKPKGKYKF